MLGGLNKFGRSCLTRKLTTMSKCKCGSNKIIQVVAKCADCFSAFQSNTQQEYRGYVPKDIGLGVEGDYVEFSYCLSCGQIQQWEPRSGLPKKVEDQ